MISLFVVLLTLFAGEASPTPVLERPKSVHQFAKPSVGYSNIAVTREVLEPKTVERWRRILGASEAQFAFMQTKYQEFVERNNRFVEEEGPKYFAQAAHTTQVIETAGIRSPATAQAVATLYKASKRMWSQLERLEHDYIDALMPILTDDQVEQLDILRHESSRRQYRAFPQFARWGNLELRSIWEEMDVDGVTQSELETVLLILEEYELRITHFLRRQALAFWSISLNVTTLFSQQEQGLITPAEFQQRNRAIQSRHLLAARRLREATEQTVRLITDSLSDVAASNFLKRAKTAAFPELYPDPTSTIEAFQALIGNDQLEQHVNDTAEALFEVYSSEYRRICNDLEALCIKWGEARANGESGLDGQQFLAPVLDPLLKKREALSLSWIDKLREAIDETIVDAHLPSTFNSTVKAAVQAP